MLPHPYPPVLLASADPRLTAELESLFPALHLSLTAIPDSRALLGALAAYTAEEPGILLLDGRLPEVANSRLLAALSEPAIRRNWALALIADEVSDEWIARLREGIVDDIVPRTSEADAWKMHLNLMQRGHSLFCELEQLREASLLEVKRDAVTGTLNRNTMTTVLFRETDRIQRQQSALALMAIDIDGFRRCNDQLGRDAGDQILRESARRIGRLLRTYDVLGRIGGDEFLLILPGCSTVNAVMLAERLRVEVFGEPFWVRRHRRPSSQGQDFLKEIEQSSAGVAIVELRLSACYGITLSRGRSPVVVMREAEEILGHAREHEAGTILCSGDRLPNQSNSPQLFSEAESLAG